MKDIMLDTNIYGNIIENKDQERIKEGLHKKKTIVIFGATIIWKDFRRLLAL